VEHSPLDADISAASQEIPHIVWNPKARYRVHISQALKRVQFQINSIYASQIFFKFILILAPSTPRSSKCLFSLCFPIIFPAPCMLYAYTDILKELIPPAQLFI